MKSFLVLSLVFSVMRSSLPGAMPQYEQGDTAKKPPLKNIKGTVKADGDKIIFVADDGGKSWDVVNPETYQLHTKKDAEVPAL